MGNEGPPSILPQLKDRLVFEINGKRKRILKMILLLYNYRTRCVGINQIQNMYYPALELDTNEFYGEEIQNALN